MFLLPHRLLIIVHDLIMVALAWTFAMMVRYDWPLETDIEIAFLYSLSIVVTIQSIILWYSGLFRGIWRFTSLPDVVILLRTALLGILAIVLSLVLLNRLALIPRSSLILYPFFLIFLLGMPRILYRLWVERSFLLTTKSNQRVLVLGAGTSGDMLVRDMLRCRNCGYIPIGFLDDQKRLHGGQVQGIPVLGGIEQLGEIAQSHITDLIIIATPSATDEQMQRIVELCEKSSIPFRTLPRLADVVNNQIDLTAVRDVAIEDLLGRAKVQLDWQMISEGMHDKIVLVSGGGGSIGEELCRQVARLNPAALIILEQCEFNLYRVEMQLREEFPDLNLHICLGDSGESLVAKHCLQRYRPNIVFHAAAYKHVPLLQTQVREAVKNNVLGTYAFAKAVVEQGCQAFVMISTDKAVNPTNVMGATKRAAEIICQAMNQRASTRFITVRFGNVLGSAGSVVPLFKAQIAKGGPVTVTDPDITRYFMTIPEACQLILQAVTMGEGGEIFVLDMGKPIKIRYLAEQMIRLSGKIPGQDIQIVYTGLRPGEKLHEELFHAEEKLVRTTHAKILLASHRSNDWDELYEVLQTLTRACDNYAEDDIKQLLKTLVPEMVE